MLVGFVLVFLPPYELALRTVEESLSTKKRSYIVFQFWFFFAIWLVRVCTIGQNEKREQLKNSSPRCFSTPRDSLCNINLLPNKVQIHVSLCNS